MKHGHVPGPWPRQHEMRAGLGRRVRTPIPAQGFVALMLVARGTVHPAPTGFL